MELLKLIIGELKAKGKGMQSGKEDAESSDKKEQLKGMIEKVKVFAQEQCDVDAEELASMIAGESPEQEIAEMDSEDESEGEEDMGAGMDKKALFTAALKAKMKKKMGESEGYEEA